MIGAFIVRVANLLEAEGRVAWQMILRMMLMVICSLVIAVVFLGGIAIFTAGVFEALVTFVPRSAASMLVGLMLMLAAVGTVIATRASIMNTPSMPATHQDEPESRDGRQQTARAENGRHHLRRPHRAGRFAADQTDD